MPKLIKYTVIPTTRFKRDVKLIKKQSKDESKLHDIVEYSPKENNFLQSTKTMP